MQIDRVMDELMCDIHSVLPLSIETFIVFVLKVSNMFWIWFKFDFNLIWKHVVNHPRPTHSIYVLCVNITFLFKMYHLVCLFENRLCPLLCPSVWNGWSQFILFWTKGSCYTCSDKITLIKDTNLSVFTLTISNVGTKCRIVCCAKRLQHGIQFLST